jgi:polar amino acid transport system substrate-binding protein
MTRLGIKLPSDFGTPVAVSSRLARIPAPARRGRAVASLFAIIGLLLLCPQIPIQAASPDASPLRVVTAPTAPFVLPETEPLSGFSIDLWNEVARRMQREFTWKVVPHTDLLSAVERGEADVAISAITMTPERDKTVDFSHPYFDSGLQIMVHTQRHGRLADVWESFPWRTAGQLFGVGVLVLLLLGHLVWLVERRRNPNYQKGYLRALGEGLWGSTLIIATGEYGDSEAAGLIKRILVGSMWLLGVVLVALFTASVTSTQTVARLRSDIRGPGDLPGKKIGSAAGTIAGEYLTRMGLPFVAISSAPEGIKLLSEGKIQAIVFDAPTLQYWAAKRTDANLQVVGPIFRPEKYGIVVAEGSPLRKPINEALLRIFEDGTYEQIYKKWFSRGN